MPGLEGRRLQPPDTRTAGLIRLPRLGTADLLRPQEAHSKGYNPGGSEVDHEEQRALLLWEDADWAVRSYCAHLRGRGREGFSVGLRTFLGLHVYWHLTQSPACEQGCSPGLKVGKLASYSPLNSVSTHPHSRPKRVKMAQGHTGLIW